MATLTAFYKNEKVGEWEFGTEPMVLGRNKDADIYLKEAGVSRCHCQFRKKEGRVIVTDTDSVNGTHVNGQRIVQATLVDNDRVIVGKYRLQFTDESNDESPLPDTGRKTYRAAELKESGKFRQNLWKINVRSNNEEESREILKADILIGTGSICDIMLQDKKCAFVHVLVVKHEKAMRVINVSDEQPVCVNGEEISERIIQTEQFTLSIGSSEITIDSEE